MIGGFRALRSLLCVRPDVTVALARDSGADALVIDLDGSAAARAAAHLLLPALRAAGVAALVRIDALDREGPADLDAVMPGRPTGIVLPGCRSAADVQHLGTKLAVLEAELGFQAGETRILAMAGDNPVGLLGLANFVGCSPRLAAMGWDATALAQSCGAEAAESGSGPVALARSLIAIAARAAGVIAVDTAFLGDAQSLAVQCGEACRMGFSAKFAAAPDQVPTINATFPRHPGEPA